ncbi:MAG: EscU/YscU/HrcU family type III secretion system export apparatus switch protein [Burkholderiales bacterium]|nr:EscU/YscU/HrcU family type III secretion system export apparatus switch protein [Burkholderiales bacterium]
MSGDNTEAKTEEPTPKKRRDAKEEGQVAQSKELSKVFALIVLLIIMGWGFDDAFAHFTNIFHNITQQIRNDNLGLSVLKSIVADSFMYVCKVILFPVTVSAFIAGMTTVIQIDGITISKAFFKFDLNKFNPVQNFKSIFSLKNFKKFLRQLFEIIIMVVITTFIIRHYLAQIILLPNYSLGGILYFLFMLLCKIFTVLIFINLISSVIDLVLEKRNLTKELMMSHSEVKQEHKNTNGNPEIKQRRQEIHREIVGDDGEATIANSTFVLANPTHIAIVVLFRPKQFKLPIIVAKAKGSRAQNIFNIAKRCKLPIIRDVWLARTLFDIGLIGKYVPSSMLAPIGDVISKNLHLLPRTAKELAEIEQNKNKKATEGRPTTNAIRI